MVQQKEVTIFDPQDSQIVTAAMNLMDQDKTIPKDFTEALREAIGAYIGGGAAVHATLSQAKQLNHAVMTATLDKYEVVALKGVNDKYYARQINPETGEPLDPVFQPTDKEELTNHISDAYEEITGTIDGAAIDKLWNSVDKKIRKDNSIEKVDNTIIQLLPNNYWNCEDGSVTSIIPEEKRCFRRLFDTPKETKHIIKYEPEDFIGKGRTLKQYIDMTEAELIESEGDLVEDPDFEFIQTVACHEHDRYMDIIRMFATFFMKNKPLGSYILEGNGRNGKSSLIGLIHTIMGTRNTSRLQLAELGNWHKNHCLVNTLVNAPDEEKPGTLEDTDLFRTIADHGTIELEVMFGQKPIEKEADFQCVSASNHLPKWKGTDAEACISRARIIPFRADLSGEDKKNINFEKLTYTPDRVIHFLGVVLGTARYYMTRPFPDGNGMEVMRTILKENMVSYRLYYASFIKFFGTYHILRKVYVDYCIWCKDHGFTINKYDEFASAFSDSRTKATSYTDQRSNTRLSNVYRVSHQEPCFYEGWGCDELATFGTIEQMNDSGISVVTALENKRDQEKTDWEGKK